MEVPTLNESEICIVKDPNESKVLWPSAIDSRGK